MDYQDFIEKKTQLGSYDGFEPLWMPGFLFDFQEALVDWSIRKGKSAIFADCGLGKTPIQLVWAQNIVQKTNGNVLIVTPLSVSRQTIEEGEKFGIECHRSRDGKIKKGITITNYERLHYFDRNDFEGIVLDESSAIKFFTGKRQQEVTEFMTKMSYRLLCTATAAPNDYIELGTSAEALGQLGRMDMLAMFFHNDENSLHPIWWGARWRFKKHAELKFWQWVCSWARSIRKPSDLGFDDDKFILPELTVSETVVISPYKREGELFRLPAVKLDEQREERRNTINERCEKVAELSEGKDKSVVWCHMNDEGNLLEKVIPGSKQVAGSHSDDEKEETFNDFAKGDLRVLITKPKIGALGLNWQHCAHMSMFPSHSFQDFYQSTRRCWRFGQTRPVHVDIVTTEGELGVLKNMQRKSDAANKMFDVLIREMNNAQVIERSTERITKTEVPSWL